MDEFVAVEELHGLSAHDINKLLQAADRFVLNITSAKGVSLRVSYLLSSCYRTFFALQFFLGANFQNCENVMTQTIENFTKFAMR
jgi:hypothetical protein